MNEKNKILNSEELQQVLKEEENLIWGIGFGIYKPDQVNLYLAGIIGILTVIIVCHIKKCQRTIELRIEQLKECEK
jgi:hypothetical protein